MPIRLPPLFSDKLLMQSRLGLQDAFATQSNFIKANVLVSALAARVAAWLGDRRLVRPWVTVASLIPLIVLFFFFMAVVEASGYLFRAASLMNVLMPRMGLNGRNFAMLVIRH